MSKRKLKLLLFYFGASILLYLRISQQSDEKHTRYDQKLHTLKNLPENILQTDVEVKNQNSDTKEAKIDVRDPENLELGNQVKVNGPKLDVSNDRHQFVQPEIEVNSQNHDASNPVFDVLDSKNLTVEEPETQLSEPVQIVLKPEVTSNETFEVAADISESEQEFEVKGQDLEVSYVQFIEQYFKKWSSKYTRLSFQAVSFF